MNYELDAGELRQLPEDHVIYSVSVIVVPKNITETNWLAGIGVEEVSGLYCRDTNELWVDGELVEFTILD